MVQLLFMELFILNRTDVEKIWDLIIVGGGLKGIQFAASVKKIQISGY